MDRGSGDWKWIPPDVKETKPSFILIYDDASSSNEKDREPNEVTPLYVDLLRWKDSNHECILFNNENHLVAFLSMNPMKMRQAMHPSLLKHLESNKIIVGEDLSSLASNNSSTGISSRYCDILGGLTGVRRSVEEASNLIDGYCLTGDSLLKMLAIAYRLNIYIITSFLSGTKCYLLEFGAEYP